jgi:hypothetical protein
VVVWARDEAGNVGAFVVEHPDGAAHPVDGYHARKITGKTANRVVWQAQITLDGVRVPLEARLADARGFDDTNRVLAKSRQTVAWEALGHAIGAYEAALSYSLRRKQFGRPIARFQLVQDNLSHITGMRAMRTRMAQLQAGERVERSRTTRRWPSCTPAILDRTHRLDGTQRVGAAHRPGHVCGAHSLCAVDGERRRGVWWLRQSGPGGTAELSTGSRVVHRLPRHAPRAAGTGHPRGYGRS